MSDLVSLGVVVIIVVGWVTVQIGWRRVFGGVVSDPDVLAGRMGCDGCGCVEPCEVKRSAQGLAAQEEAS